jgi:hypothetical protein
MNLTSLRIGIIIIAANSYDISEMELQALREIVTISQSWIQAMLQVFAMSHS